MVSLDRFKVLDITAWGKNKKKLLTFFKILKIGCWAVLRLGVSSLGGCDVPVPDWGATALAGDFFCTSSMLSPNSAGWRIF
jgi:hypothetical protein